MSKPDTTELFEFKIAIEWHAEQRPEKTTVIARGLSDAKTIALMLFKASHTNAAVVDDVREDTNG